MLKEVRKRNFRFIKKIIFISIFITITPIALFTSIFALVTVSKNNESDKSTQRNIYTNLPRGVQIYASLPSKSPSVYTELDIGDSRVVIINDFLQENESPMTPYADFIVKTSDKYGLDYRLITAIAMKESGLGKLMPHDNCNNAWGYGIHKRGTLCFDTWEEGIETVSKGLRENYLNLGLVTPEEIMSKWIPHSPEGLWAVHVEDYMSRLN